MSASKDAVNQTTELLTLAELLYRERNETTSKIFGDIVTLNEQRREIASLLGYHSAQLYAMNPIMFQFLKPAQRAQVEKQLIFTLYLLAAQAHLDDAEDRTKNLQGSLDGINLCLKRLGELKGYTTKPIDKNEAQLKEAVDNSEKYLKFLGLTILAPWLVSRMTEFFNLTVKEKNDAEKAAEVVNKENDTSTLAYQMGVDQKQLTGVADGKKTSLLVDWMSQINGRRLYWVWGGGMLASALELLAFEGILPSDQIKQAQSNLSTPSPITGYMSWVLYYTRFAVHLGLLLKHTIAGPWMSPEEAKIPAWERFKTQLVQRKFAIINDSVWATANLVCFFWLRGGGALGHAGNILTALLLLMDLILSIVALIEESTKHNKEMEAFNKKEIELGEQRATYAASIDTAEKTLAALRTSIPDYENNEVVNKKLEEIKLWQIQLAETEAELKQLQKIKKQSEMAWKYKKFGLINNTAYAAGLLFAFALFCCFFFPPAALAPALILVMGVAGAALCFTLTILYAAINGGLDIAKSKDSIKAARAECKDLMIQFAKESDPDIKKQLYLEMKALMAESEYQERLVRFQAVQLARAVFVDAFIPALVFASLVFMPLGIGLGVMAAGLAVAVISHLIISRFAPEKAPIKDLKDVDLAAFEKEFKTFEDKFNITFVDEETSVEKITDDGVVAFFAEPKKTNGHKLFDQTNKSGYQRLSPGDKNDIALDGLSSSK
ncbi:hypothetical protein [Legionella hackeliae]|uniref:Coiled-coil protein n=1 Tax=Legionella hackeliae TaxID=449 RepID=A0A0A8UR89_LEGHA|nr:hypothetical protein [Legionella hackeliae]KTD13447.1 hypothetical protein Lhac_0831 [Legionella hackeliae]CEK09289.1 membrane protein of unknown function [Legionella hackeliae]STX49196.1 Uncharacterised protein [Legionella hackeliae]